MTRTWDSTMSMIPKGGDTIWGGLDWSPEDGFECKAKNQKGNDTEVSDGINGESVQVPPEPINYGRLVSFGKDVAEAPSSKIERIEFRVSIQQRVDTTLLIFLFLVFIVLKVASPRRPVRPSSPWATATPRRLSTALVSRRTQLALGHLVAFRTMLVFSCAICQCLLLFFIFVLFQIFFFCRTQFPYYV